MVAVHYHKTVFQFDFALSSFKIHLVWHICVYTPTCYTSILFTAYLNTLDDLEGFIVSQTCDHKVVVGDFNVDFDHGDMLVE